MFFWRLYTFFTKSWFDFIFSKRSQQEKSVLCGSPRLLSPSRGRTILGATGLTVLTGEQGGNEVRWRQGQEASLPTPCSQMRFFESKCTVMKAVRVTLLGLPVPSTVILRPHSDSAPGDRSLLSPLAPDRGINFATLVDINEHGRLYYR